MMSKRQFSRLRHGDVVLWGKWPRVIFRTVVSGPVDIAKSRNADPIEHLHVSFPIRHRSWTGRAVTSYGWNDLKHIIRMPRKPRRSRTVISREELARLTDARFNVRKQYVREIRESLRHNKRLGRVCPFVPLPLPKP